MNLNCYRLWALRPQVFVRVASLHHFTLLSHLLPSGRSRTLRRPRPCRRELRCSRAGGGHRNEGSTMRDPGTEHMHCGRGEPSAVALRGKAATLHHRFGSWFRFGSTTAHTAQSTWQSSTRSRRGCHGKSARRCSSCSFWMPLQGWEARGWFAPSHHRRSLATGPAHCRHSHGPLGTSASLPEIPPTTPRSSSVLSCT